MFAMDARYQVSSIFPSSFEIWSKSFREELELMDVNSQIFTALPPEMQHDLLIEKKEVERYAHTHPNVLPKVHVMVTHVVYSW